MSRDCGLVIEDCGLREAFLSLLVNGTRKETIKWNKERICHPSQSAQSAFSMSYFTLVDGKAYRHIFTAIGSGFLHRTKSINTSLFTFHPPYLIPRFFFSITTCTSKNAAQIGHCQRRVVSLKSGSLVCLQLGHRMRRGFWGVVLDIFEYWQ
jgi:hypothetical protein